MRFVDSGSSSSSEFISNRVSSDGDRVSDGESSFNISRRSTESSEGDNVEVIEVDSSRSKVQEGIVRAFGLLGGSNWRSRAEVGEVDFADVSVSSGVLISIVRRVRSQHDRSVDSEVGLSSVSLSVEDDKFVVLSNDESEIDSKLVEVDGSTQNTVDTSDIKSESIVDKDEDVIISSEGEDLSVHVGKHVSELASEVEVVSKVSVVSKALVVDGEEGVAGVREDSRRNLVKDDGILDWNVYRSDVSVPLSKRSRAFDGDLSSGAKSWLSIDIEYGSSK